MRLFFDQRLDCDLANFILAHKPLHFLYVSPLKTVDHCIERTGSKGRELTCPSGVPASNPWRHVSDPQHARTDQGHRTSMRRVPGVYVLSIEPRLCWGGSASGCLLCAPRSDLPGA